MATRGIHFKSLRVTPNEFEVFKHQVDLVPFNLVDQKGFIVSQDSTKLRRQMRLVFPKTVKAKSLDLNKLDFETKEWNIHFLTDFVMDNNVKVIMVDGPRNGFKAIEETISAGKAVLNICEFNTNVMNAVYAVRKRYKDSVVKSMKVKGYKNKFDLCSNVTFKPLDDGKAEQAVDEYADKITSLTSQFKDPDTGEKFKLSINDKGSVSLGGAYPATIIEFIQQVIVDNSDVIEQEEIEEGEEVEEDSSLPVPPPPPVPGQLQEIQLIAAN